MDGYTTSELLKAVAARRHREPKECPACRSVFNGWARQLYCSRRCADRAFYVAHKAERNAARTRARRPPAPSEGA
jgi:predicted anti-sigma-YlaC factor YlaD